MSSQVELCEHHAKDCLQAAERTEDPLAREMLLMHALEWMREGLQHPNNRSSVPFVDARQHRDRAWAIYEPSRDSARGRPRGQATDPVDDGNARKRRHRIATLRFGGYLTPAPEIFFAKTPSPETLPPFWANRFWTGFWERGHEQFSESNSPTTGGSHLPQRGVGVCAPALCACARSWRILLSAFAMWTAIRCQVRAARRYLAAISKCLAQSNKSHTGVPATNSSQIPQQG